jgi:hypothetical protein
MLMHRFFEADAHDMPVFLLGTDGRRRWPSRYVRWQDAEDPRQCVAHLAFVLLSARPHEAAAGLMLSTLEWLFASRRRRAPPGLLRNEMTIRMLQIDTGELAGLPYCDSLSRPSPRIGHFLRLSEARWQLGEAGIMWWCTGLSCRTRLCQQPLFVKFLSHGYGPVK